MKHIKKIPIKVPAIETCFMSIDEIAQIFSKSQGLYRGGEFKIFSLLREHIIVILWS